MSTARQQLNMSQLTSEVYGLQDKITRLQCDVSKLLHVQRVMSNCIKVLWGMVAPVIVALAVHWAKSW